MPEAGININCVALHFDIHKTTAYRIKSVVSGKQYLLEAAEIGQTEKSLLNCINVLFISHQGGRYFPSKPALLNVYELSLVRDYPPKLSRNMHVDDGKNIDILSFSNAPYN